MATAPSWQTFLAQITGGQNEMYKMIRAVIDMESSENPNAVNVNNNGSIDRGLLQLNNNYGGKGMTASQQFNPYINLQSGTGPLIRAYTLGKDQGLSGYALFQHMVKNGDHPALLTRADAPSKFAKWVGGAAAATSSGGLNWQAGLANLGKALAQPGGATAATPVGGVTENRDTQQAENSGVDANGNGETSGNGGKSLWAWITGGDVDSLSTYAKTAGWGLVGGVGGLILLILGVVLIAGSFRGSA